MELLINILHKYTHIQIHMYFLYLNLGDPFMHHRHAFLGMGVSLGEGFWLPNILVLAALPGFQGSVVSTGG